MRPGIGYVLGRGWTVWGGYAYIRTELRHIPRRPPTEQRIWEQASWSGAIGATALSSRTRMEAAARQYRNRDGLAIAATRQGGAADGLADDLVSGRVRRQVP